MTPPSLTQVLLSVLLLARGFFPPRKNFLHSQGTLENFNGEIFRPDISNRKFEIFQVNILASHGITFLPTLRIEFITSSTSPSPSPPPSPPCKLTMQFIFKKTVHYEKTSFKISSYTKHFFFNHSTTIGLNLLPVIEIVH